jgi:hypothetical protein
MSEEAMIVKEIRNIIPKVKLNSDISDILSDIQDALHLVQELAKARGFSEGVVSALDDAGSDVLDAWHAACNEEKAKAG